MAIKMKLLRLSKNISKAELANRLDVTFRTITNWEKADGVVPSLLTMKRIANAIGTTTYDVFCRFIYKPDEEPGNEGFNFSDHTSDIARQYMTPSQPLRLFKYINDFKLFGTGIVIYKYKIFRYKTLMIHEIPSNDEFFGQSQIISKSKNGVTRRIYTSRCALLNDDQINDRLDRSLLLFMNPSDGLVAIDENENSLILSKDNISSWHIVSNEVSNIGPENETTHTVFEIEMTSAIFPEMEEDIRQNKKSCIYLDAYRYSREEFLPFTELEPVVVQEDCKNVIGLYLQSCRKRIGLSQAQLAQKLQIEGVQVTNGTINRWENGSLLPGAHQLSSLCTFFHVDIEKLLDAFHYEYFVSNAIDAVDRCYNLGLHHSFGNATDFNGLRHFLNDYIFFNLTTYNTPIVIGHCSSYEQEDNISSIETTGQKIVLRLTGGNTLEFSSDELEQITPVSLHMSTFYEFKAILHGKVYTLFFAYNIQIKPI